ncbi:MAG: Uma2 family endonuclease [Armatimonadetes bacterium]|nr:Uma2 family endonuclease [Armatimonadota bacterium]
MERAQRLYTPEEYLALERAAETKSELYEGEIVAMSGGTAPHALIAVNASASLVVQLRARPCRVYSSDLRVRLASRRSYFYPDVSVACGDIQFADDKRDTLLNPLLVLEVLSPSTEGLDRGVKWGHYQLLPSLQHYVLIAQDRISVEVFTRQEGQWGYVCLTELDASAELPAINCRLPLSELYDKVEFPPEESLQPASPEE